MSDAATISLPAAAAPMAIPHQSRLPLYLAIAAGLVAGGLLLWRFWPWRGTVSTDDAFIDGHISAIGPVGSLLANGRVIAVHVDDNQHVVAGQLLVEIDPAPWQAKVDEARASLAMAEAAQRSAEQAAETIRISTATAVDQAKADVALAEASVVSGNAAAEAARADAEREDADRRRIFSLANGLMSAQQRDIAVKMTEAAQARAAAATANTEAARAAVAVANAKLAATAAGISQVAAADAAAQRARADVERTKALVREAEIDLDNTRVVAPYAGTVTRKSVEVGSAVQAGQSLLSLVGDELWVVANLKEGQLPGVVPGSRAEIDIDAYPGVRFAARVDSLQSGSGTRFSLLPAENATGNFVKVVQRVPVKLVFIEQPDRQKYHVGPGMSVVPTIWTR